MRIWFLEPESWNRIRKRSQLDVKPEQNYVAVFDNVIAAFLAHFTGVFAGYFTAEAGKIIIGNGFSADEAFLEIGMNDPGGSWCFGCGLDGPGARFLGASRKICNQPK